MGSIDERARGYSITHWLLRIFETDGQDLWYSHAGEEEEEGGAVPTFQFAQLDLLCEAEACDVGVMPFAIRLHFRVPAEPGAKRLIKVWHPNPRAPSTRPPLKTGVGALNGLLRSWQRRRAKQGTSGLRQWQESW